MLIKDSTAVSNQWCMPVNLLAVQFCLTPGLLSTRSKVIKFKYENNPNTIIRIMTGNIDKNQLEPGKGAGLSPKIYQLDNHFIFWSFMRIISFAYS